MFKKLVLTVLVLGLMVGVGNAGGVTDDNNGNKGDIFVSTGENHGANSVGEWVDSSAFKGEKGDTGATGPAGQNGTDGRDGIDGLNGANGQDGQNGLDGVDGAVGPQGDKGEQGIAGQNGEQGVAGIDGKNGEKGDTGSKGDEGKKGDKGQQGIQGPQGKGLEDRVELIGEIRILDTRKTTWAVYAGRDFNNNANIVGAKVTYKLGKSYEEKRLDELEAKLNMTQATVNNDVTIIPTATGFKIQVIN